MDLKKNKKYKVKTENPRLYQIRVLGITLKSENLKFEINFACINGPACKTLLGLNDCEMHVERSN